jgi:oxygen-independent coproporphyrinogen-3 oxidase
VSSTTDYVAKIEAGLAVATDTRRLSDPARIEEALFTGLRLAAGIDARNFEQRFGVDPWRRHAAALAPYLHDDLVWRRGERFGLTRRGMLVANEILVEFISARDRVGAGTVE